MTAKMWRRVAALVGAGVSALALLVLLPAAALAAAAPTQYGRAVEFSRVGPLHLHPQTTVSAASIVGLLAIIVAATAMVWLAFWAMERSAGTRPAAVPGQPADDEWQAIRERQATRGQQSSGQDQDQGKDQGRKAA